MNKKILLWVLGLALIGSLVVYKVYNKSHVEPSATKADFAVDISTFTKEYLEDETGSDTKYLDKIVELSGVVKEKLQPEKGSSLSLETGIPDTEIICEFEDSKALDGVNIGDQITVRGICAGTLISYIQLTRCAKI